MTTVIRSTEKNGYIIELVQSKYSTAYQVKVYNLKTGRQENETTHATQAVANKRFSRVEKSLI